MARKALTVDEHQAAINLLEFIIAYKTANDGNSPTLREMASYLKTNSTSYVTFLLDKLEGEQRICRPRNKAGAICVSGGSWSVS